MASFTRRFRILKHLLAATEHQNAAMQLMLEDPDLDATVPPDSGEERERRRKKAAERPTVLHPAFNSEVALAELNRAASEAGNDEQRARVAEMAQKLREAGLIDDTTAKKFEKKIPIR